MDLCRGLRKSRLKSFDQTFSKVCAGRGREALVARRNERNSFIVRKRPKEGEFFVADEKEGENHKGGFLLFHFYFGFTLSKPFPFFLSKLAQKEPKMPLLRGVVG